MNPERDMAETITEMAGIKDGGKLTEAFTRLFHKGARDGYWGLTREDWDAIDAACDEAFGRPHKRHRYLFGFTVHRWWHWHVVDPIIYPILEAPFTAAEKVWWHAWKKRHGGTVFTGVTHDDGEVYLDEIPWAEWRDRRNAKIADLPWGCRIAAHLGRLHSGWAWECPACECEFARPGLPSEAKAAGALDEHARDFHAGIVPGECGVTEIYWTSWGRA